MAKIILILSILAMGGATFFGIKNRQTLIELKKQTIDINKQIDRDYIAYSDAADAADKIEKNIASEEEGQAEVVASIGARKREVSNIENAIKKADDEIAATEAKTNALQRELDALGVTPETLLEEKDAIEKAIVLANEEAETLKGEIDLTRNVIAANRQATSAIRSRLQKRKEAIGARQLTVSVRDVNDEFGFIVLSAGKNSGVASDSQFLILRGSTLIAKVTASTVQESVTIANVVPGSLSEGAVIMPGDTAILDAR
ncbi:MAG: hypothetical protein KDN22_04800 [Verrucomicrobiae bacterium]|nr:hypothetical protein [Verrucomicrobiae bacterium]